MDAVIDRTNRVGTGLYSGAIMPEAAVQELKAILAIEPRLAEGHMLLGMAYRMQNPAELAAEARAELIQALDLKPDLLTARFLLAQIYLEMGRGSSARDALEAGLRLQPGQPQLTALLGETERQLGNAARALELGRQAVAADPAFAQGRYYFALALLDAGQRADAITELERVVGSGARAVDAYVALGTAYTDAGQLARARETLSRALALDASRDDARIALARACRLGGLLEDARQHLDRARAGATAPPAVGTSQPPLETPFYLELGLLEMRQGHRSAAIEAFEALLASEPRNAEAARYLAQARRTPASASAKRRGRAASGR